MNTHHAITLLCSLLFFGHASFAQNDPAPEMRPVYIITEIDVNDKERYEDYRKQVAPLIARHGGRYLVRSGAANFGNDVSVPIVSPEGNWLPDRIIVLEFPSRAHLVGFVGDPDHKAVAAIRQGAATTRSIVADGYLP